MNKKVSSVVALVCWIVAAWLLLPFDSTLNSSQLGAPKVLIATIGVGVLVNLYRSFFKATQQVNSR